MPVSVSEPFSQLLARIVENPSLLLNDFTVLKALALQAMNGVTLAGSVLVKAPQLFNIWRAGSVAGLSESSFFFEASGLGCGVLYNVLRNHPFATWGELLFLWVQCLLQLLMFWFFSDKISGRTASVKKTDKQLPKGSTPMVTKALLIRILALSLYLTSLGGLYYRTNKMGIEFPGGDSGLSILGTVPMVIGTGSRIPQIVANFSQGHTGTLSLVTWVMSLGGNLIRVVTTLALVADPVTLLGHVAALIANVFLVGQIIAFWKRTQQVMDAEKSGKKGK